MTPGVVKTNEQNINKKLGNENNNNIRELNWNCAGRDKKGLVKVLHKRLPMALLFFNTQQIFPYLFF